MNDDRGPITLISDMSERRNRWRALAFAWRAVAVGAVPACSACGRLASWYVPSDDSYRCDADQPEEGGERLRWHASLARALELEQQIERGEAE